MPGPTIYVDLAEHIRDDVLTYRHGVAIPSVRSLGRRYNVSPNTVRKALGILLDQQQITTGGPSRPYLRYRPDGLSERFYKPYPGVALLSYMKQTIMGDGYVGRLTGRFLSDLRVHGLMTGFLPGPDAIAYSTLAGGLTIGACGWKVSGVALLSGGPSRLLADWVKSGTIVMTLDFLSDVDGVDSVAVDCKSEADLLVGHLAPLGHRVIAYICTQQPDSPHFWHDGVDPDSRRFSQAMLDAKRRAGLDGSARYHVETRTDKVRSDAAVRVAVDRLWRLSPPPTALVCFDPVTAAQARAALAQRGLQCPRHVSIVARDEASQANGAMTVLASDAARIGAAAAEHMVQRLASPAMSATTLQFASTLKQGHTTGPAARSPLR